MIQCPTSAIHVVFMMGRTEKLASISSFLSFLQSLISNPKVTVKNAVNTSYLNSLELVCTVCVLHLVWIKLIEIRF